jgi:hypothetical protein
MMTQLESQPTVRWQQLSVGAWPSEYHGRELDAHVRT